MSQDLSNHPGHSIYIQGLLNKALDEISYLTERLTKANVAYEEMLLIATNRQRRILNLERDKKDLKARLALANSKFNPRLSKEEVLRREEVFVNSLPIGLHLETKKAD
jgi:hypothetical protein